MIITFEWRPFKSSPNAFLSFSFTSNPIIEPLYESLPTILLSDITAIEDCTLSVVNEGQTIHSSVFVFAEHCIDAIEIHVVQEVHASMSVRGVKERVNDFN